MTAFDPATFSLEPNARRITKPWGYEVLLSPPDVPYTAKLIHVHAGKRLSLQLHDVEMQPGVGYHIAVGQRHRLCAAPDADATVFEASTPELGVTLRLEDDYARPDETEALRQAERAGR